MLGTKIKKIALLTTAITFASMSQAETYYYDDFHPKYESKMTIEEAENLEVQVFPTMVEYEKLGDFYNYDEKYKNLSKAYEYYRVAAREGSNYGQYMTGKMKLNGSGVEKNIFMAREFLEQVKSPYQKFANRLLAESYLVTGEVSKAKEKMELVDSPEAMFTFAQLIENEDQIYALDLLKEAADMGHVHSHQALGKHYLSKSHSNTKKAIEHLKVSAKAGMEESQYLLGELYFKGSSQMYADHEEGLRWYLISGQNGNEDALRKAYWILSEQEKTEKYNIKANPDLRQKLYTILYSMD